MAAVLSEVTRERPCAVRFGEDHPQAKLTNYEIELVRRLHEEDGKGYGWLARKFELSKGAVAKICRYERR